MRTRLSPKHKKRLLEICEDRGGELVHDLREGRKVTLRCDRGHTWHPDLYNVLKGSWCSHPECVSKSIHKGKVDHIRETLSAELRELIQTRKGKWISGSYVNSTTKIELECSKGHRWRMNPGSLKAGQWCPKCAGRLTESEWIKKFREIANRNRGRLISRHYNTNSKLEFECSEGHRFKTSPASIKNGTWCPKCATSGVKLDLSELEEELKAIAKSHRGALVSLERVPEKTDYLATMRCEMGHEWSTRAYNFKKGHWCPTCNTPGVREKVCRAIFEWICGEQFPKKRPNWLINSRGNRMELDGYCKKLGIAFEYQGKQHSEFTAFFHSDAEDLARRIEDDSRKSELCREHGVDLYSVDITIPIEELPQHLLVRLQEGRADVRGRLNTNQFDFSQVKSGKSEQLAEISRIAKAKGGECLSKTFISNNHKLEFRCELGHQWKAVPYSITSGSWCPECAGARISEALLSRRNNNEIREIIEDKGGEYLGKGTKNQLNLLVRCSEGHEWETDLARLHKGHWCQKCAAKRNADKLRLTIDDLREVAKTHGGKCLSQNYKNSQTRYLWQCGKDSSHRWLATANSVRRGTWCPACAGKPQNLYKGNVSSFLRQENQ